MSLVDMTKYNGVPLTSVCSGGPLPSNLYQYPSGEYILVSKKLMSKATKKLWLSHRS